MQRCLHLAGMGAGYVAPNPMVGAVIVFNGRIIGEGYHAKFGHAHAEVHAISSVREKELLPLSTLYVNLEPCNHSGKTPPCTDLIIRSGIPKVVIGMKDPFPPVNGKGIQKLMDAGIEVTISCEEEKCEQLNKRFITFHTRKRPFILLKWAESMDGFIGREGEQLQLSNHLSRILTHQWRSNEMAIMAGSSTVKNDNPLLNVRFWFGKDPLKITIDRKNLLDRSLNFFQGQSMVFTDEETASTEGSIYIKLHAGKSVLEQIMDHLYQNSIQSVLVEGGSKLHQAFIREGLWDEAAVFKTEKILRHGIKAPFITGSFTKEELGNNALITFYNK